VIAERRNQFLHALDVRVDMRAEDKRLPLRSILPYETRFHIPAGGLIGVCVRDEDGFPRAEQGREDAGGSMADSGLYRKESRVARGLQRPLYEFLFFLHSDLAHAVTTPALLNAV